MSERILIVISVAAAAVLALTQGGCGGVQTLDPVPVLTEARIHGDAAVSITWLGIPIRITTDGELGTDGRAAEVCVEIAGQQYCADTERLP